MINWILQRNLTKPDILKKIQDALSEEDETFETIEVIPFSNQLPPPKNTNSFNIIYGSTTFMINAFNDANYQQGVFYHPDKFQMSNYVRHWGTHILNHDGKLITLGKLHEVESDLDKKWFIRPNHDGKEFSGRVNTFEELVNWSKKIIDLHLPDLNETTEIWIAEPQLIEKEWRIFIVDDNIISSSRYMLHGELNESDSDIPNEMIDYVEKRIKEYHLDEVYVMDIAEVNQQFKIIECNCFNGTGFYKHNIEKVIQAVNDSVRKKLT